MRPGPPAAVSTGGGGAPSSVGLPSPCACSGAASSGAGAGGSVPSAVGPWPSEPCFSSALLAALFHDLVLEREEAVHERLGAGRAAGYVDVDGDDLVDAL